MIRQFTLIPALLVIAALIISACSADLGETGGESSGTSSTSANTGAATVFEGTWVSSCRPETSLNVYRKYTETYVGNTLKSEQLTYSDDQCTIRSSGADFRGEGTFTVEDGDILDGKQLTKFTKTSTVLFSEGFAALFFPIGSTTTLVTQFYVDGNTMYDTDNTNNLSLSGNGYDYVPPTQIEYDLYVVRQ